MGLKRRGSYLGGVYDLIEAGGLQLKLRLRHEIGTQMRLHIARLQLFQGYQNECMNMCGVFMEGATWQKGKISIEKCRDPSRWKNV